jgi:hypothetical protein
MKKTYKNIFLNFCVTSLPELKILWILLGMTCVSCQLLSLPTLPNARSRTFHRSVSIKKCCNNDQCLDRNYECVNLPGKLSPDQKSEEIRKIFQRSVCAKSDDDCAIAFNVVGFSCLSSQVNVTILNRNFENETFPFPQLNELKDEHCLDFSLKFNSILQGPFIVKCQQNELSATPSKKENHSTYVSKCCKNGQVIDFDSHHCVTMPEQRLNTPFQKDYAKNLQQMSNNLKVDTREIFSHCSKTERSILKKPRLILTNKSAVYYDKQTKLFDCLDMVTKNGNLIGLFTLHCQNVKKTKPVKVNTGDPTNKFPMCCSLNEVLDHVNLKCTPNFTFASRPLRFLINLTCIFSTKKYHFVLN